MNIMNPLHSDHYATIGDTLRNKRESLGISLEEAAHKLRIRFIFLQALENNEIDKLPAIAYASGFIRTYADFLGLNGAELVQRFRSENQGEQTKTKLMFPVPVPQSGVPAGVYIFFGIVIIAVAYIGWYKMTDHQQIVSNTVPTIASEIGNTSSGDKISLSPQVASVIPAEHPAPLPASEQNNVKSEAQALEQQIQAANQANKPTQPGVQPSLPQSGLPETQTSTNANNQQQESDKKLDSDKANVVTDNNLYIHAEKPSWLLVKSHDGHVLFQRVLKADEKWMVPADQSDVMITVGNAGVVTLERNGKQSSVIGKVGKVKRNLILNQQALDKLFVDDHQLPVTNHAVNPEDSGNDSVVKPNVTNAKPLSSHKNNIQKKPARVKVHPDLSADDLNAKQLNY